METLAAAIAIIVPTVIIASLAVGWKLVTNGLQKILGDNILAEIHKEVGEIKSDTKYLRSNGQEVRRELTEIHGDLKSLDGRVRKLE